MKFDLRNLGLTFKTNTLGGLLLHFILAVTLLIIVSLLYFYAYLPHVTNHGESITVPSVEGLPITRVEDFLASHDLRYEVNDSSYSAEYPPLTVLKQYPAAGAKVKENRKIFVSVNRKKPPTVKMPNLIDKSLTNAEAVLRGSELKRGKIRLVPGPFLNVVSEMQIDGNKVVPDVLVPKGTVVDLVVMDGGSNKLPTPNVLGFSYEDAKFNILGSNLTVGDIILLGDTSRVDAVVLKQVPARGAEVMVGDVINLWIGEEGTEIPEDENTPEGGSQPDGQNE
ncbi:MAG TPA: PASTA domain-containing protein [Chryseosolibacter sp.]|nr:PASTA domain-containing protein [Chryseosolibacter sp.]